VVSRRIVVDDDLCLLAGECVYNHPEYFAWNDDDSAVLVIKPDIVTEADETHAGQAIPICPGGAISIVED
jgi:ferredoxin